MATGTPHIFFIAPYPKGAAPSQRFRFEQYLSFLEKEGYSYEFHPFYDEDAWKTLYAEGQVLKKSYHLLRSFWRRFLLLFQLRKADFIFVHREMSHVGPPIFEWITTQLLGKKIIYDFDDAIWLPNYSEQNARFQQLKMYKKVFRIMRWAHLISAGNEFLCSTARKYNSKVNFIPTTIDLNYHQSPPRKKGRLTVGWTGTHTTAKYLHAVLPVLEKLQSKYDFDFLVISNENPAFALPNFTYIPWNKTTEIQDLNSIDIGIMPLEDSVWTQGKCAFKILQYMALSKPCVASPVGANLSVIEEGVNGRFAKSEEEWFYALEELLSNEDLRIQLGKKAFETVREGYSVEANQEKYLKLFQK
ncbi:Glycosyltransferase involved in cell wall bisynthesis [Lishizhenia tianjinensis]|uniref:Glycosyltransferase involved in cell wall bisynthesis n=1 Tax=Lishizhenia tianjinensis TaxID=477690 RepID=A0A1I7BQS8_9FLAO|nr:glycosyltransferase family 4 protein [Lishizhenia tianjinensis]SFT89491.1 Glycosyltransferase involved in cell wall bisynthesis [Lishizhenia tianjinensis]